MRRLLFAASAALLIAALPSAGWAVGDDDRRWYLGGDERDPYLAFGNQDLGETAILVICNNRRKIAELSVADQSKDAKAGQSVTIEVTSPGGKASFSGKTVRSAGIYGYARKIDFKTVASLLRSPGPVTVTMGNTAYKLHDRGRAKAVGELIGLCALN